MLGGKNLSRSHNAPLIPIANRYEYGKESHQGLPASHITLQQTVHLSSGAHTVANFLYYAFLGSGKRKRHIIIIEIHEWLTHYIESETLQ